jgi:hypothetical protein
METLWTSCRALKSISNGNSLIDAIQEDTPIFMKLGI